MRRLLGSLGRSTAPLVLAACAGSQPAAAPDVLLVTIDTLRADFLGCYGSSAGASPEIDRLAAESALFERAVASASMTAPAHAAIFTSRYSREHSVGHGNGRTRLVDEPTLAEQFSRAGYRSGAFVGNMVLRRHTGLDRGFEHYDAQLTRPEASRTGVYERTADETTDRALRWLARADPRPVFLWVHYQDPHGPYLPPAAARGRTRPPTRPGEEPLPRLDDDSGFRGIPAYQVVGAEAMPSEYLQRYGDEIFFADRSVGRLLEAFDGGGAPNVVLLTADHGESLGEHDFWFVHAFACLPELAHVPLLLRAPGIPPGGVSGVASHVDIAPTLLELAGLPALPQARGLALGPLLRERRALPDRSVFCDIGREIVAFAGDDLVRASGLEDGPTSDSARWEHYRWERSGRISGLPPPDDAHPLRREILRYAARRVSMVPVARAPSPEELDALRALGYADAEPGDATRGAVER